MKLVRPERFRNSPCGVRCATINTDSPEHLVEAIAIAEYERADGR